MSQNIIPGVQPPPPPEITFELVKSAAMQLIETEQLWPHRDADGIAITHSSEPRVDKVANARLIAAAPELLEALQAIVKSLSDQDDEGMVEHAQEMIDARAAIAKAMVGAAA